MGGSVAYLTEFKSQKVIVVEELTQKIEFFQLIVSICQSGTAYAFHWR